MCRIGGVSLANFNEKLDISEISACLFPEMVRQGPHAYGWMSYNDETEEITSEKFVGRSDTELARSRALYDIDRKARWIVLHTRFATHGDPKDLRNDHPIPHGKIIGVHNGVLRNHSEILDITGRDDPETEVDSEAIFAAVNKWGPTKGLRRIQGDMVTIYANRERPRTLHIARTHGRQLTLGFTVKGNLIWASDQSALHKLEPEIKFARFTTISENRLLYVQDGRIVQRYTFRKPEFVPERRFVPPPARIIVPTTRTPVLQSSLEISERTALNPDGSVKDFNRWLAERQEARAERRGQSLFPLPDGKKKPRGGIVSESKREHRRAPRQNEKLHYFDGQLMTSKEYEETIASLKDS